MKNFSLSLITKRHFDEKINKLLSENPSQPLYVSITKKEKKRGLPANAQQHVFYAQIAKHYGTTTALEIKNMCKDMFGLPILHNSEHSGDQIEFLTANLNYYKRPYESRLKLVQCLAVTSLFNTVESKMYMDQIIFYYKDLGIMIDYQD